jgi:hypothetical protein
MQLPLAVGQWCAPTASEFNSAPESHRVVVIQTSLSSALPVAVLERAPC